MKKTTKLLGVILFAIIILFVSKSTVQAKSYKIENMDIQATINKNGSVSIKQEIKLRQKLLEAYNLSPIIILKQIPKGRYEISAKSEIYFDTKEKIALL